MFGNLVSSSKLYSYLMSSFLLSTDGFLSRDLSGAANPRLIPPLMPWGALLCRIDIPGKSLSLLGSELCLMTGKIPCCECFEDIIRLFLKFGFFEPDWFKLIDSRTGFVPMPELGGPVFVGGENFPWRTSCYYLYGKYLLPPTPPERIGLLEETLDWFGS